MSTRSRTGTEPVRSLTDASAATTPRRNDVSDTVAGGAFAHRLRRINVGSLYDRVAASYPTYRWVWVATAGRAAERRLRAKIDDVLRPGQRVLDAGCGTGTLTHAVLAREPTADVIMLDASPGMLHQADVAAAHRARGDLAALPFRDGSFDVVVSAWVLETVDDAGAALRELLRVLAPDGQLLTAFSSQPRRRLDRSFWRVLQRIVESQFGGRFLRVAGVPFHDCTASSRRQSAHAPAATMFLSGCCTLPAERRPR